MTWLILIRPTVVQLLAVAPAGSQSSPGFVRTEQEIPRLQRELRIGLAGPSLSSKRSTQPGIRLAPGPDGAASAVGAEQKTDAASR
jgi:hypothetical protein